MLKNIWKTGVLRTAGLTIGLGLSIASIAGSGSFSVFDAGAFGSTVPDSATLKFAVSFSGPLNFDVYLNDHTVDGTAAAGVDFLAPASAMRIPAGSDVGFGPANPSIPIALALQSGRSQPDRYFQLVLDSAVGTGPLPNFLALQSFPSGADPYAVTTADINADGWPDLIVANSDDGTVSVLLNTGGAGAAVPTFAARSDFAAGDQPYSVVAADVNGDGRPDLIVSNFDEATVSVLLNTTPPGAASPSFSARVNFATGSLPAALKVADMNGDGRVDIVVTNLAGNSSVSVLLNTTTPGAATPSFAPQIAFPTDAGGGALSIADVNGDGHPDVLVANFTADDVSVLINTMAAGASVPSLAAAQNFATGLSPADIAVTDVNGDGRPDLLIANDASSTISVLVNRTIPGQLTADFASEQSFPTGAAPMSINVADVNGDGRPDMMVANYSDGTLSVLLGTTSPGSARVSFAPQQTFPVGSGPDFFTIADLNGDGLPDVIASDSNSNTVSVLFNTTALSPPPLNTSFPSSQDLAAGTGTNSVITVDINGDGLQDIVALNGGGTNVSVMLNATLPGAAATSYSSAQSFTVGNSPSSVFAADINGDGHPDLIVTNSGDNTVSVLLNGTVAGAATSQFAAQLTFPTGGAPSNVSTADVNGDGRPDLLVANRTDNTVSVLLNTTVAGATTPGFSAQQAFATDISPRAVASADVNGDGRPDLLVANFSDMPLGGLSTISVFLNTTQPGSMSPPTFSAQQSFPAGNNTLTIAIADINGDGRPDAIVAGQQSHGATVLLNTTPPGAGVASFAPQQTFSTSYFPTAVTAKDLDGDGRPDLIVTQQGGGFLSLLRNTTPAGAAIASFAGAGTLPSNSNTLNVISVADLNGDDQQDLVVADSSGTVHIYLSTNYLASLGTSTTATGTISFIVASPTNLTAVAGDTSASLHWSALAGAESYNIYQSDSAGGESAPTQMGVTATETVISGLTNGSSYFFRVTGVNAAGESSYSNEANVIPAAQPPPPPPAAPTNLAAIAADGQVKLTWLGPVDATEYEVDEGLSSGSEIKLAEVSTNSTTITGLVDGTQYYFTIKSIGQTGISTASAEVSAVPLAKSNSGSSGGSVGWPLISFLAALVVARRRSRTK